ncbi:putative lyase [Paenibacillus konkukensis]|uniref:Lyase n=1 Tax=Paenibacillus konkukensis TaxID=2020716 RepID=A0ABY4RXE4_9BACL|nr:putative lyase [Paenibacillus konkukensis]
MSKRFYTELLGFRIIEETYRAERQSYKLDLQIAEHTQIELFSFPDCPPRLQYPEARGLRHLAFEVIDVEASAAYLREQGVDVEPVRVDPVTGKKYTFFKDPDDLPLELYEA